MNIRVITCSADMMSAPVPPLSTFAPLLPVSTLARVFPAIDGTRSHERQILNIRTECVCHRALNDVSPGTHRLSHVSNTLSTT